MNITQVFKELKVFFVKIRRNCKVTSQKFEENENLLEVFKETLLKCHKYFNKIKEKLSTGKLQRNSKKL